MKLTAIVIVVIIVLAYLAIGAFGCLLVLLDPEGRANWRQLPKMLFAWPFYIGKT